MKWKKKGRRTQQNMGRKFEGVGRSFGDFIRQVIKTSCSHWWMIKWLWFGQASPPFGQPIGATLRGLEWLTFSHSN